MPDGEAGERQARRYASSIYAVRRTLERMRNRRQKILADPRDYIRRQMSIPDDLDDLERLASVVKQGSLCGLGRTAPNPIVTTLRYFRQEYEAHLAGRCPAGKCKALIEYSVTEDCIGCTLCAQHCPARAIGFAPYEKHEIDAAECIRCGTCKATCPMDAITIEE